MRLISLRAPTSTPRVGSISMRIRASAASQRATCTFCWLPPESVRTSAVERRRLDPDGGHLIRGLPAHRPDVQHALRHVSVEACDADIVGDGLLRHKAVAPILRHEPETEPDGVRRAADRRRFSAYDDLALRSPRPRPIDRQRGSDRARTEQAEQADDLAFADQRGRGAPPECDVRPPDQERAGQRRQARHAPSRRSAARRWQRLFRRPSRPRSSAGKRRRSGDRRRCGRRA